MLHSPVKFDLPVASSVVLPETKVYQLICVRSNLLLYVIIAKIRLNIVRLSQSI